jgi:hypothetical protein
VAGRPGAAARISDTKFGTTTRIRDRAVSVGTALAELIPQNPDRVAWQAINRSVNNGALGFDREVTFANGVLLGAGGGFAAMSAEEDGEAVTQAVFAINDTAAGTWRVIEVLADVAGREG